MLSARAALLVLVLAGLPILHAEGSDNVPPGVADVIANSRAAQTMDVEFPFTMSSWPFVSTHHQDKHDARDDLWLVGARPTLVCVVPFEMRSGIGTDERRVPARVQAKRDKLRALLLKLEEHAAANAASYSVLVVFGAFGLADTDAVINVFADCKLTHLDLAHLTSSMTGGNSMFSNYWSNFIERPTAEMIAAGAESADGMCSWVWMPRPGVLHGWGIRGYASEDKRLEQFVNDSKPHEALALKDDKQREIAMLIAAWRLGEAEKRIEALEKAGAEDVTLLRDYMTALETFYREDYAGAFKAEGYIVKYAELMQEFAGKFFDRRSTRGQAIAKEFKEFEKSNEYKQDKKAKDTFDSLHESIYSKLRGDLHGEAYSKHYMSVLKSHKSRIEKFNNTYGDTPYAKQTKKWAEELAAE